MENVHIIQDPDETVSPHHRYVSAIRLGEFQYGVYNGRFLFQSDGGNFHNLPDANLFFALKQIVKRFKAFEKFQVSYF